MGNMCCLEEKKGCWMETEESCVTVENCSTSSSGSSCGSSCGSSSSSSSSSYGSKSGDSSNSSGSSSRGWELRPPEVCGCNGFTCAVCIAIIALLLMMSGWSSGPKTLELMTVRTIGGAVVNDHMYIDITNLDLSPAKLKMVGDVYTSPKIQSKQLHMEAASTGMQITPHLVYRYFQSSDWGKGASNPKFYGKR